MMSSISPFPSFNFKKNGNTSAAKMQRADSASADLISFSPRTSLDIRRSIEMIVPPPAQQSSERPASNSIRRSSDRLKLRNRSNSSQSLERLANNLLNMVASSSSVQSKQADQTCSNNPFNLNNNNNNNNNNDTASYFIGAPQSNLKTSTDPDDHRIFDACKKEDWNLAKTLLINKRANPNAKGLYSWTALHMAAWRGQTELVVLLLKYGALVDTQNSMGSTALHCAAIAGHVECCKALLQNGADPSWNNYKGETPLDYAESHHFEEVTNILRNCTV